MKVEKTLRLLTFWDGRSDRKLHRLDLTYTTLEGTVQWGCDVKLNRIKKAAKQGIYHIAWFYGLDFDHEKLGCELPISMPNMEYIKVQVYL